jgi:hypothetical protein
MAFPFSLGATGDAFKQAYKQRFNADPNFGAAFGYDMVKLVGQASQGKAMTGDALAQSIIAVQSFESLNGPVSILPNGEINPDIVPAVVSKGEIIAR